jgi:hypothetical protein
MDGVELEAVEAAWFEELGVGASIEELAMVGGTQTDLGIAADFGDPSFSRTSCLPGAPRARSRTGEYSVGPVPVES